MEALSRVQAEHLNLKQRRGSRTERKGEILEIPPLIAASATIWGQRGESGVRKDFDWLPTSPLGYQLVDKLIFLNPAGFRTEGLILDLTTASVLATL